MTPARALVLVLHYVLTRTSFGKSMFAVGGNVEAARRAGINVRMIYLSVFAARRLPRAPVGRSTETPAAPRSWTSRVSRG